jgi:hypothetical protein
MVDNMHTFTFAENSIQQLFLISFRELYTRNTGTLFCNSSVHGAQSVKTEEISISVMTLAELL